MEALEFEERTPENNHLYADDSTNQAYIGWKAALSSSAGPAVEAVREALKYMRTSYRMDVMRLRELGRQTSQADEAIQRADAALDSTREE